MTSDRAHAPADDRRLDCGRASRDRVRFKRRRCGLYRSDTIGQRVRPGGEDPAIGRRQVGDRRPARGSWRNLRRRPQDRQRHRALGAAGLYSGVANGQTTIFALGERRPEDRGHRSLGRPRRRRIAALLNAAIPGNDIHVRTVADSIILMGSVASAERGAEGARHRLRLRRQFAGAIAIHSRRRLDLRRRVRWRQRVERLARKRRRGSRGKVINSLIIRGLDQVSLRVTVTEIRREIVKQLGVNMSGSGPNGSFTLNNPFAINGDHCDHRGDARLGQGRPELHRDLAGVRAPGRRPYARRADGDGGLRRKREVPRRRHDADRLRPDLLRRRLLAGLRPTALRRDPQLHAGGPVAGPHPAAHRDRSHGHRLLDPDHLTRASRFPGSAPAATRRPSNCPRAARSPRRA